MVLSHTNPREATNGRNANKRSISIDEHKSGIYLSSQKCSKTYHSHCKNIPEHRNPNMSNGLKRLAPNRIADIGS